MSRFNSRYDSVLSKNLPPLSINNSLISDFSDEVVQRLMLDARRCGAGSGAVTVWDHKIRDAWELTGDQINGVEDWADEIHHVLLAANETLIFGGPVRAQLSKLVIYQEDGHFQSHRDTLRAGGHIATLVVCLRSAVAGGELVVGQHRPQMDPPRPSNGDYSCSVFFADTPHKIRAVDEGIRVSLVFEVHRDGPVNDLGPRKSDASSFLIGEIEKGEFALLRHRYQSDALSMGALVGEDRTLAEQWISDGENDTLVVGELLVFERSDDYADVESVNDGLEIRVTPKKRLTGDWPFPNEQSVELTPSAMAYIETFIESAGCSFWTGNEATINLFRYRIGVLMRWPRDKNRKNIESVQLDSIYEKAEAFRLHHLKFLRSKIEAWSDPNWLDAVKERVEKTKSARVRFAEESVEEFFEDPYEQSWYNFECEDPVFHVPIERAKAMTLAAIADGEGWTVMDRTPFLGALARMKTGETDSRALQELSTLRLAEPVENLSDHLAKLSLKELHLVDTSYDQRLLEDLRTLRTEDFMGRAPYDLRLLPNLEELYLSWGDLLAGSGNKERGPVRVSLRDTDFVEVISPRLRQLEMGNYENPGFNLRDLYGAPNLRILSLEGHLDLSELPDGLLPSIRRLELLHRPRMAEKVSFQTLWKRSNEMPVLEHLSLGDFDLADIPQEFFRSLKSLELTNCIGVDSLPEMPQLRLLRLKGLNVSIPENLSHRLETLHLVDTNAVAPSCQSLPQLRELYIEKMKIFDLSSWGTPVNLRHLELSKIETVVTPNHFNAAELESLVIHKVDAITMPTLTLPRLRTVDFSELNLTVLPDLNSPELLSIHLRSLPVVALPPSWSQPAIQTMFLFRMPNMKALPDWISGLMDLNTLVAADGILEELPCLKALQFLHTMELWRQNFRYDDAFKARIHSIPGLLALTLTEDRCPIPAEQLRRVFEPQLYEDYPVYETDPDRRPDAFEDDDIPF